MEIVPLLKLAGGLIAIVMGLLGLRRYGNLREDKGKTEGIRETTEAVNEDFIELADDVLNGGHPYGVSDDNIAEISSTRVNPKSGMASDI